jgi:hypothetical protein
MTNKKLLKQEKQALGKRRINIFETGRIKFFGNKFPEKGRLRCCTKKKKMELCISGVQCRNTLTNYAQSCSQKL